ncbi:MAG: MBL fold metallo-hydrolase [Holophagales bacterium]|nr:MBL fold metallo-hydrolase [Holophagales bacterium]
MQELQSRDPRAFGLALLPVLLLGLAGGPPAGGSAQESPEAPGASLPDGFRMRHEGDGLYWLSSGFQQTIFLVHEQGVIVVDAPPSMIDGYLAAIRGVTDRPVTHVIYSHGHRDHIGAADRFPEGAVRIAHRATLDYLRRTNDSRRPLPTITFEGEHRLEVGGQVLELSYRGPNHMSGNIFIWAPRQRVLCLMDFLFTGSAPFPYLGHAEDIPSFLEHHDFALAYDFERFVTGHIAEPATRADVERQRRYLFDLRDHTDAVLEEITIPATAARLGDVPIMRVVATYLDDVAREVERRMLDTWAGRWPGVEDVTRYNAVPMIQSRRVD